MTSSFGVVVKNMTTPVGGHGFDSRSGQIGHCRQRLATAATFLRRCVAQALRSGDGVHRLGVIPLEYNEEFFGILSYRSSVTTQKFFDAPMANVNNLCF